MKNVIRYNRIKMMALMTALSGAVGCSPMNDSGSAIAEIELSGQINSGLPDAVPAGKLAGNLAAAANSDYDINCVTLEKPARNVRKAIRTDGTFSINVPSGIGIACFVVSRADDTPLASLYVVSDDKPEGASGQSSMTLEKSVSLGKLDLDSQSREIRVPKSRLGNAAVGINENRAKLDDMADKTYSLSCVSTGNSYLDSKCEQNFAKDSVVGVYFRVLSGERAQETIRGLGVWESQAAFQSCGGIDMTQADEAEVNSGAGITFPWADKISIGAAFTVDPQNCPLRNPNKGADFKNIQKYYAVGEVEEEADGYTLHSESNGWFNDFCREVNKTTVHFRGKTSADLIGQFYATRYYEEHQQGACAGSPAAEDKQFIIELKQK